MENTKKTSKFAQAAENAMILSRLMKGRNKLETEDIIGEELTIDEFDVVVLDGKNFGVCHFIEKPDSYYNAGTVLTKIFMEWADMYGHDIEAASNDLAREGGVRIRLTPTKTRKGNNLTNVSIML